MATRKGLEGQIFQEAVTGRLFRVYIDAFGLIQYKQISVSTRRAKMGASHLTMNKPDLEARLQNGYFKLIPKKIKIDLVDSK